MDQSVISIHKITNSFYDEYYSDVYESDKQNLLNFSKFLGNSLIFAHNAPFDMGVLNSELKYWGLNEIPTKRYRCSMRIFMDIIGKIDIKYSNTFTSLTNCCEYFKLKSNNKNFHNALFDSFMTSKMICKIYETLDKNEALRKKLGYNQQVIDCFFPINKRNKNDIIKKSNKTKTFFRRFIFIISSSFFSTKIHKESTFYFTKAKRTFLFTTFLFFCRIIFILR